MAFLGFEDPLSLVAIVVIAAALLYSYARKALLTFTITVACCVVFGLEVATSNAIWIDLALYHDVPFFLILSPSFQLVPLPPLSPPWTLVTYQFVHGNPGHLFLNVLALIFIAPAFEDRIGSLRFGVLYFVGGIVGGGGFLLLYLSQPIMLVGASASISSVFGAYGRLYPRERVQLFLPLPNAPSFRVIDVVIGFLVLETALGIFGRFLGALSGIAWQAHVIAMALGFAIAPLVMRLPSRRQPRMKQISFASWRSLAATPELREILEEAEKADLPEIRDAWMEKFVQAMRCPQCGGPVKRSFGRLSSSCGWHMSLR